MRLTGLTRLTGRTTRTMLWRWGNKPEDTECSQIIQALLRKRNGVNGNGLAALLGINCRLISRWKLNHKQPSRANLALLRLVYADLSLGGDTLKYMNMTKADIDEAVRRERRNSLKESLKDKVRRAIFDDAVKTAVMEMIDTTFNAKTPRTGGDKS